ncbi:hypothetical protein OHAE_1872 [Ochrobactrum soli]|uniref:Uncharacterized protein n=1 Tax=Ochrobactrum soli TaxID=2448455 RepID=A0A2P9HPD9_9HYPH|nr:hypothetical protein OHAE_1872 [[Ochrobactrum] soli]
MKYKMTKAHSDSPANIICSYQCSNRINKKSLNTVSISEIIQ